MTLKLMFIAVTWACVTFALIAASLRTPNANPKDLRLFWFVVFALAYIGVAVWGLCQDWSRNTTAMRALTSDARVYNGGNEVYSR